MANKLMELTISKEDPDVAYLSLPDHPEKGASDIVSRTLRVRDLIENYKGPDLYLDFDKDDCCIGIEILS